MQSAEILRRSIKIWIILFMLSLIISETTAFALETELGWMNHLINNRESSIAIWINKVYTAIHQTNIDYPFLAYGYDWLAFAHIVIAVSFIGPLRDPVRNKWIIQFGTIACLMIFPLAFIAGHVRSIPLYWQLIDCSFGAIGLIPLCICYYKINLLEKLEIKIIKHGNK